MSKSENHDLKPPTSVLKIAGFLGDIQKRHELGTKYDVGDIWDQHSISVSNIADFVDWLHVERKEAVPPERELAQEPQKSYAKKNEESEPREIRAVDEALDTGAQEPEINVHLWKAIFQPETKRRRREMPQSQLAANRAQSFAQNYNGGLLLAQIKLTQEASQEAAETATTAKRVIAQESQPQAPTHLTQGLSAQAFGNEVVERNAPVTPVWNEPVRRDLLPHFIGRADTKIPGSSEPKMASPIDVPKIAAVGALAAIPQLQMPMVQESVPTQMMGAPSTEPMVDKLFGQITLVAPPLDVSPNAGQGSAVGLRFDWKDMAKGAGPVDYPTLITIAKTLPEGSRMLYPAIDPRQLRGSAVNIKLEPSVAEGLAGQGYGSEASVDGKKSLRKAYDYEGGMPAVSLLPATLSPLKGIGQRPIGMSADNLPQGNAVLLSESPHRTMRFLDFFGLPIYLSPQLNTSPDTDQEMKARVTAEFLPRAPLISGQAFGQLRNQMLGGFYGVEAKPELGAWRTAAPDYDRAGSAIAGLLASRIRMGGMGDGIVNPKAAIPKSATMPLKSGATAFGPTFTPKLPGSALATRVPLQASPFLPPSMPEPSIGSGPQMTPHTAGTSSVSTMTAQPMGFRPSIPSMPTVGQDAASSTSQSATASVTGNGSPMMRVSPHLQIPAEKSTSSPPSMPAKQSESSSGPSHGSSLEMPSMAAMSMPAPTTMAPQTQFPRPISAPGKPRVPSEVLPPKQSALERTVPTTTPMRPPNMAIAPRPVSSPKSDKDAMAVQTSTAAPSASSSEGGGGRANDVAQRQENGMPGSEINLLATEVWSLLKRKLAFEAQRSGR